MHNPEVFVKRCWSQDELELHWGLLPPESGLLRNKSGATRLGFSLLRDSEQVGRGIRAKPATQFG